MLGTIATVKVDRGFGFISPSDSSGDLFFHMSQLRGIHWGEQLTGMRVEFTQSADEKTGRVRAIDIRAAR